MAIDLGNAPIGTPPTTAEQNQIRLALLSLGRQQNLSEVSSAETSRANLGLAKNQTDPDSIITHDGTITNANNGGIPVITGNGEVGTSGKSFGATVAESSKAASSTRVALLRDVWRASFMAARVFDVSVFDATVTGSGSSVPGVIGGGRRLQTGATPGSTAICQSTSNSVAITPGSNRITTVQNMEFMFGLSFIVDSSDPLPASGGFRYTFGKSSATAGALTSRGFGILCKEGNALYGIYNNGSSEIEVDLGVTAIYRLVQDIVIYGDGTGGLEWIVNGVSRASVSNYSTSALSNVRVTSDVLNDTESFDVNCVIWPARMATLY